MSMAVPGRIIRGKDSRAEPDISPPANPGVEQIRRLLLLWRRSRRALLISSAAPRSATGNNRIIGRNLEERRIRLRADDVRQLEDGGSTAWIIAFNQDVHLKVRGIPPLDRDCDWLFVADLAGRDRSSGALAFGRNSTNQLRAERFSGYVGRICARRGIRSTGIAAEEISRQAHLACFFAIVVEHVGNAGYRILDDDRARRTAAVTRSGVAADQRERQIAPRTAGAIASNCAGSLVLDAIAIRQCLHGFGRYVRRERRTRYGFAKETGFEADKSKSVL